MEVDRDASQQLPIVILPLDEPDSSFFSVDRQLSAQLVNVANDLGRFRIYDRNQVETILKEHSLRHTLDEEIDTWEVLQKLTEAKLGFKMEVKSYTQKGIPPEEYGLGESLMSHVFGMEEQFESNIESNLSYELTLLDIRTNEVKYQNTFNHSHTGGTRGVSQAAVTKVSYGTLKRELNNLFKIESQLSYDQFGNMVFKIGPGMSVKEGSWFYLRGSGIPLIVDEDTLEKPTKDYALAQVNELGDGWAKLEVIKQWDDLDGLYYAQERTRLPTSITTSYQKTLDHTFQSMMFDFNFTPMEWYSGFLRLQMGIPEAQRGMSLQNYSAMTFGFGLGVSAAWRVNHIWTLRPATLLDINFANRSDDGGNLVHTLLFSTPVHLDLELHLGKHWSLVGGLGYRTWGQTSTWRYTVSDNSDEKSESKPAEWEDDKGGALRLKTNGTLLRLGVNYLFL